MSIQTECPHCGKTVNASNKRAGKTGTCPGCGEQMMIPQIAKVVDVQDVQLTESTSKKWKMLQLLFRRSAFQYL